MEDTKFEKIYPVLEGCKGCGLQPTFTLVLMASVMKIRDSCLLCLRLHLYVVCK
jgi:hypothetical protein